MQVASDICHSKWLNNNRGGAYMAGSIKTYQNCPRCGAAFPSSKGGAQIICQNGCKTQPTKFFISVKWKGLAEKLYHDRDGRTIHDWGHAIAALGEIRTRMKSHKSGKMVLQPIGLQKSVIHIVRRVLGAIPRQIQRSHQGQNQCNPIYCHGRKHFSDTLISWISLKRYPPFCQT